MSKNFWALIRQDYDLPKGFINLENGYYCTMPNPVLDVFIKNVKEINSLGSYYMRNFQEENKSYATMHIADMIGCSEEEVIITRNTTESLGIILNGIDWKEGDQLIVSCVDYGSMRDMARYLKENRNVIVKMVSPPLNPLNDESILAEYRAVFNENTKYILIPHIVHLTGQIMPIKKLCKLAHRFGIKVIVDGAHAIGQIDFKLSDLNCDFYASSLHKWLSCPLGVGILWIKGKHISDISPIFADYNYKNHDILRLNHTGTYPVHNDLTIKAAIDYYNYIGRNRKERRLRELTKYWIDKLSHIENVIINTPVDSNRYCAIGNIGLRNMSPSELHSILLEKYNVWTVAINEICVKGVRVTVNIYTTFQDLNIFVDSIKDLSKK
jgi:selenocysteine lyase/cysteine desulfurase